METKQEWKIGDCLKLLPEIPDKSIDMILTDLPYGTTACSWDTVISLESLWEQYKRIIKVDGAIVLTSSQPFTSILINSNMGMFKYCWIWKKTRIGNIFNCKNAPQKNYEDICIFSKSNIANGSILMKYNPQGLKVLNQFRPQGSHIEGNTTGNRPSRSAKRYIQEYTNYPKQILEFNSVQNTIHPTQKPLALWEYLIKTYTNEGDTVHDSCLGSGTTLEACMNLNRNCIGFELSDEWEEHYKKRLRMNDHKLDKWV